MSELQRVAKAKWYVLLVVVDDYALIIERALRAAVGVPVEIRGAPTGEEALALVRDRSALAGPENAGNGGPPGSRGDQERWCASFGRRGDSVVVRPRRGCCHELRTRRQSLHHKAEQSSGARGETWRPASEPHGVERDPSWVVGFLDDGGQRREPPFDGCAKGASLGGGRGRVDHSIHLRKGFRGVLARWR